MTKVYVAKCTTVDPEAEGEDRSVAILGVFSSSAKAKGSFTKETLRVGRDGSWISKHICFRGYHEIDEYEIDGE